MVEWIISKRHNGWFWTTQKIDVLYRLKYLEDSTKIQDYTEAQTVLRLSDHYALYTEYYKIALDSINDLCAESKKKCP